MQHFTKGSTIVIAILIIIGGGLLLASLRTQKDDALPLPPDAPALPSAPPSAGGEQSGVRTLALTEGRASYVAQKKWFSKPTETVTGTTESVSGTLSLNENTNTVSGILTVSTAELSTGNAKRDSDVRSLLGTEILASVESLVLPDTASVGTIPFSLPVEVTIQGVAVVVPFDMSVVRDGDGGSFSGSGVIDMTDFNLAPPNLLNIYTVDPVITLGVEGKVE